MGVASQSPLTTTHQQQNRERKFSVLSMLKDFAKSDEEGTKTFLNYVWLLNSHHLLFFLQLIFFPNSS